MINVYICPKYKCTKLLHDGTVQPGAVLYPEIEVAHFEWFDFYHNNQNKFTTVVTQSSEFIKFLRESKIECKVYIMVDDTEEMVEMQLEDTTRTLLSCYEQLSFKGYFFDE